MNENRYITTPKFHKLMTKLFCQTCGKKIPRKCDGICNKCYGEDKIWK